MSEDTANFGDEVNQQIDSRKLRAMAGNGELVLDDIGSAPVISESSCCGADMIGEEIGKDVLIRCGKCGAPQMPKPEED
jgi:hypothetical protein